MGAAREPDQADFDLERFINLFDEAMTSKDPRVIDTLRSLMMIVTLTRPEASMEQGRREGPLRRLFEDMHDLNRSVGQLREEINDLRFREQTKSRNPWDTQDKYTMAAAANMAQSIDTSVMRSLSKNTAMAINGGTWPKGKL
jgi:hypothetical protein